MCRIVDSSFSKREKDVGRLLDLVERTKHGEKITSESIQGLNILRRPYSEPVNQIFEKLYSLNRDRDSDRVTTYNTLLQQIIQIIGGDIAFEQVEGISPINFVLKIGDEIANNSLDLPMHLASSSANQLTLIYLYLKYWVEEKDNFLMIDEPEENLHPANQARLVDILIQFATQNNNKVLIITHSPLLAEVVNNYVYLGTLKNQYKCNIDEIIAENDLQYLNSDTALNKDEIGVYFFAGDRIIDYEADMYGVYFRDFQAVNDSINKSGKILTDYIYAQESEDV